MEFKTRKCDVCPNKPCNWVKFWSCLKWKNFYSTEVSAVAKFQKFGSGIIINFTSAPG